MAIEIKEYVGHTPTKITEQKQSKRAPAKPAATSKKK